MNFVKKLWTGIFGEGTDVSKTSEKGFRGAMTFVASLVIANIDSISVLILKAIPDNIEAITVSGLDAGDITVQAIIVFVLVGLANLMKRSPFTKDNKLVRAISG